jgi:hypothetical protein
VGLGARSDTVFEVELDKSLNLSGDMPVGIKQKHQDHSGEYEVRHIVARSSFSEMRGEGEQTGELSPLLKTIIAIS